MFRYWLMRIHDFFRRNPLAWWLTWEETAGQPPQYPLDDSVPERKPAPHLAVTNARHGWGFFYWVGVGFLTVFGFVAILSIGLPFFVLGVVLLAVGVGRGPVWPADLGLLAGAGLVCLLVA